jgi:hypothetical protein
MPNNALEFRIGETKRIAAGLSLDVESSGSDTPFSISSVSCSIYNSAGTAVVSAAAGGVAAGVNVEALQHEVFYLWTPDTAGTYNFALFATIGTQTLLAGEGYVTVLALTSKFDAWERRIIDWLVETQAGEAQQHLSDSQLRDAATEAVRVYSSYKPRRVLKDAQALTANVWEYSLWSEWEDRFSMIEYFEYPIDATSQARNFLNHVSEILIDEPRSKWQFKSCVPSTGETYRVAITCRHTLSAATDSISSEEPADWDAVAQWAAGEALEQIANKHCGTEGQGVEAQTTNFRDKAAQYSAQARKLKAQAVNKWRPAYVVM